MSIEQVERFLATLDGVHQRHREGMLEWRCRGRLVARQLDQAHLVIRAEFDVRAMLLHDDPATFSVPRKYEKHMMVVADLADGDPSAIEDALEAAWRLQRAT
jgi:hypothetical protein